MALTWCAPRTALSVPPGLVSQSPERPQTIRSRSPGPAHRAALGLRGGERDEGGRARGEARRPIGAHVGRARLQARGRGDAISAPHVVA